MSEPPAPPPDRTGRPSGIGRLFLARVVASYGTRLAFASLSLVNVLLIARVLGPTGRGEVAFLTAVAVLTSYFSSLGVHQANANIAGAEPERRRALATNSLLLALGLAVAAVVMLSLLIALVPAVGGGAPSGLRWLAFAAIPPLILSFYLETMSQAAYRFAVVNVAAVLAPVVVVAVNGGLALAGELTVGRAVAAWVAAHVLSAFVLLSHIAFVGEGFGRPDVALARRTIGFGLKVHVGVVLNFGNYRLDQWILGSVAGARELGLYSVAVAWSEALFFLPNSLAAVQRPDLVRASPAAAYVQALRAHRIGQLATIALALVVILAAEPLCVGVFGAEFRESVNQLRVLALGGFGIVALKQLGDALTAQRRPTLEAVAIGTAFAATLFLDILLIPPFGAMGAAVASSVAYTIGGITVAIVFYRTLGAAAKLRRESPAGA